MKPSLNKDDRNLYEDFPIPSFSQEREQVQESIEAVEHNMAYKKGSWETLSYLPFAFVITAAVVHFSERAMENISSISTVHTMKKHMLQTMDTRQENQAFLERAHYMSSLSKKR